MRLTVGMTGATGAVFGVRLLENLARLPDVETHLVMSRWARSTVGLKTGLSARSVGELADCSYSPDDQGSRGGRQGQARGGSGTGWAMRG